MRDLPGLDASSLPDRFAVEPALDRVVLRARPDPTARRILVVGTVLATTIVATVGLTFLVAFPAPLGPGLCAALGLGLVLFVGLFGGVTWMVSADERWVVELGATGVSVEPGRRPALQMRWTDGVRAERVGEDRLRLADERGGEAELDMPLALAEWVVRFVEAHRARPAADVPEVLEALRGRARS